jgi:hypothetical protein
MSKKTIVVGAILIAVILIVIFSFVDFSSEEIIEDSQDQIINLNENDQGYIDLETSDDDFAAIDDALNALDG